MLKYVIQNEILRSTPTVDTVILSGLVDTIKMSVWEHKLIIYITTQRTPKQKKTVERIRRGK
jgi:hypothetical protein